MMDRELMNGSIDLLVEMCKIGKRNLFIFENNLFLIRIFKETNGLIYY